MVVVLGSALAGKLWRSDDVVRTLRASLLGKNSQSPPSAHEENRTLLTPSTAEQLHQMLTRARPSPAVATRRSAAHRRVETSRVEAGNRTPLPGSQPAMLTKATPTKARAAAKRGARASTELITRRVGLGRGSRTHQHLFPKQTAHHEPCPSQKTDRAIAHARRSTRLHSRGASIRCAPSRSACRAPVGNRTLSG